MVMSLWIKKTVSLLAMMMGLILFVLSPTVDAVNLSSRIVNISPLNIGGDVEYEFDSLTFKDGYHHLRCSDYDACDSVKNHGKK